MHTAYRRPGLWVILFALAAGTMGLAQSTPSWTPITDERLASPEPGDWMSYRRTNDVTAFSPLRQIDRRSVRQLRPVWSYAMRDNRRWLATPIVANGLMYVPEGSGRVTAFDAVSGDVVWIHDRRLPADIEISEAYARARGVAIYRDTIYWGTADSFLLALDARTGALRWEVKTDDYRTGGGHNHPPLIADGIVFLGHAGGDNGTPGRFRAFDAESGKLLWTVNTSPTPGDPGYETWTRRDVPPLGGAPWNTISYDPEFRLVYFSTGQPAPWSTALRGPGDALYTNTVLAVDARSGKIRWHFQLNPADDWDRAGYENMLVDLPIGGRTRKALIQTGKMGWGVVLDRQTGEFLHAFKTAYDNVVTGWTKEGRPIVNPALVPTVKDVDSGKVFEVCPHLHGARNLQAPSYSPVTRLYYLGVNNSCMDSKVISAPYVVGRAYTGVSLTAKKAPGYDYVGEFVAFDPATGARKWAYRTPSGAAMSASALATAGGIVFGGTSDREFFALHSDTGELLWQTRLTGDVSGAPISYAIDGTQYIAITAGGRAAPTMSFSALTGATLSDGSSSVWVFAAAPDADLKIARRRVVRSAVIMSSSGSGVAGPPPPPMVPATGPVAAASALNGMFTTAQAARGEQQFARSCATCHSLPAQAASLRAKWGGSSLAELYSVISTTMPQNAPGSLTPAEYASIVAVYLERSGHAPGTTELSADPSVLVKLRVTP
jgi:alcohol dehydrogenase (cytochrome c)